MINKIKKTIIRDTTNQQLVRDKRTDDYWLKERRKDNNKLDMKYINRKNQLKALNAEYDRRMEALNTWQNEFYRR